MGIDRSLTICDEREQRAALRDRVLQYGHRLGWSTRTAIAFTEQLARRPWKRCTSGQLWTVLDELHALLGAWEVRQRTAPASLVEEAVARPERRYDGAARR
jgi:hypothetical protein